MIADEELAILRNGEADEPVRLRRLGEREFFHEVVHFVGMISGFTPPLIPAVSRPWVPHPQLSQPGNDPANFLMANQKSYADRVRA
jgi:hypothetical protein